MQEITIKRNKHLLIVKVPKDLSMDAMNQIREAFEKEMPGLNVMLTQGETELTVLKLED